MNLFIEKIPKSCRQCICIFVKIPVSTFFQTSIFTHIQRNDILDENVNYQINKKTSQLYLHFLN
jgi:hypothetical protein